MYRKFVLNYVLFLLLTSASAAAQAAYTLDFTKSSGWLGKDIIILFLDGTDEKIELVKRTAVQWSDFGNFNFKFIDGRKKSIEETPESNIRISFDINKLQEGTAGHSALYLKGNKKSRQSTMVLGDDRIKTILHEFGHALGLSHEHQNPLFPIEEFNGQRNCGTLSRSSCNRNVKNIPKLTKKFVGTQFDRQSVMIYDGEWSNGSTDFSDLISAGEVTSLAPENFTSDGLDKGLSLNDKMAIAMIYPGKMLSLNGQNFQIQVQPSSGPSQIELTLPSKLAIETAHSSRLRPYVEGYISKRIGSRKAFLNFFKNQCLREKQIAVIDQNGQCEINFSQCPTGAFLFRWGSEASQCFVFNDDLYEPTSWLFNRFDIHNKRQLVLILENEMKSKGIFHALALQYVEFQNMNLAYNIVDANGKKLEGEVLQAVTNKINALPGLPQIFF